MRLRGGDEAYLSEWHVPDVASVPDERVRAHMPADPVTVFPETSLADLAQSMLDAHVHRVVVVDEGGRPVGIISGMDVLAAVARAARPDASAF